MPTHIFVTAPEGRKTPLHPTDGADPGGLLAHVEAGHVVRVRYSQGVRRSIGRGDLIPCNMDGAYCADLEHAAAEKQPEHGDRLTPEMLAERRAGKAPVETLTAGTVATAPTGKGR